MHQMFDDVRKNTKETSQTKQTNINIIFKKNKELSSFLLK